MSDWYSTAGLYVCCPAAGLAFEAGAGAGVEDGSGWLVVGWPRSGRGIPSLLLWPSATRLAAMMMQTTRAVLLMRVLRS
jgi:hypothetical protein